MALTYEQALETLCSMFEGWDRETITAVFESNGYHVERTIETILSMEQPNPDSNASPATNTGGGDSLLDFEQFNQPLPTSTQNGRVQAQDVPSTASGRGRGTRCQLPNDFLRRPSHTDQQFLRDEQLALMLQNELFQREVQQAMGEAFDEDYFERANRARLAQRQVQRGAGGRADRGGPGESQSMGAGAGAGELSAIPDMGILKALQDMGDGMKNQLHQLAVKFNSSTGMHDKDDSDLQDSECRPLTAADYEEEDEEDDGLLMTAAATSSSTTRRVRSGHKKDN